MTFQELVVDKQQWIDGHVETLEGEYEGYNTKIADLNIDKDIFLVYTTCGHQISVNTKYSEPKVIADNIIRFNIPCIGVAYMTKPPTKGSHQRSI